jgi:glycosyltransferase involved in cell wall biosynthesis
MKISVLIPAFRAEATLAHALDCVLRQTHPDWEIVVVEDGSRDGTEDIVRTFASRVSQPVRYENLGVNQGVAAARNRLLSLAAGDAAAFLDADDGWTCEHLARAAGHLSLGADLVVTGVRTFDLATGETLAVVTPPAALAANPVGALFDESVIITSSCVVLSRGAWTRTGEFDPALRIGEDRDYWLRAALAGLAVRVEPAVTCHYAKHAASAMARTLLVAEHTVRFYEKQSALAAIPVRVRRRRLASALADEARLLRATDAPGSARRLARAWKLRPADFTLPPHLAFSLWRCARPRGGARTLLVANRLGGQCAHSGIHQLARFLHGRRDVQVLDTPDTRPRRWVGKLWSLLHRAPARNQSVAYTEMETRCALAVRTFSAVHFLVGENHTALLAGKPASRTPVVATLHMPASVLAGPPPKTGCVHTLVLLTARDAAFFAGAWGARQTVVIPHGVDTEFFQPRAAASPAAAPSILVVGRFLRDFPLTAATVMRLAAAHPEWSFDFVVPAEAWHGDDLAAVRALPNARWHDRIDDTALRALYQNAACHLTPFRDCTANNALVESLACGLPVVTTDRGGVRDYGAGTVYPLAAEHTADALAQLCERYVAEPAWRARIAAACRAFALESLAWPVVARRHLALYAQIAQAA